MVIGASAVDITARAHNKSTAEVARTTAPGTVSLTFGGVGRNVAEAAHRVLSSRDNPEANATLLVSSLGRDDFASALVAEHDRLHMRTDGLISDPSNRTAVCNMVLDTSGQLVGGVADMDIVSRTSTDQVLLRLTHCLNKLIELHRFFHA